MVKKYPVFVITRGDIDDVISGIEKEIKHVNDKMLKKSFLQMKKAVKENPHLHHKKIMIEVMKEVEPIRYSMNGRFIEAVQRYMTMTSSSTKQK